MDANRLGPRLRSHMLCALALASLAVPSLAHAQYADASVVPWPDAGPPAAPTRRTTLETLRHRATAPRDEILGWDPVRGKLLVVERTPSELPGFQHIAIVEVLEQGNGGRTWLTTAQDILALRASTDPLGLATTIDARVRNEIAAARTKVSAGAIVPISEPVGACTRAPFPTHVTTFDDNRTVTSTVSPDGVSTTLQLAINGRNGDAVVIPSTTLAVNNGPAMNVPYNRLMDLRELPGTDKLAALVRSDACLPEGEPERARAVLLPAFPTSDRPLNALTRSSLDERTLQRAIVPHARMRTRDGQTGYFDGNTRVTFNAAWNTPDGKIFVQYTRRDPNLSPILADQGHAQARFVILEPRGRRYIALHEVVPPLAEDVFEGVSWEAFSADMDGDSRPELFVRTRYNPDGEVTAMFRWADGALQYMWRGQTRLDERIAPLRAVAEVRKCDVGVDGPELVMRCRVERYPANGVREQLPTSVERMVQRVRSNGGAVSVLTERQ